MKALTVGEMKSTFSDVLASVQRGERYAVAYGRKRKPVAMIVPYVPPKSTRALGVLSGRGQYRWRDSGFISDEEFLAS